MGVVPTRCLDGAVWNSHLSAARYDPRVGVSDVSYLAIARKYRPATFDEIVGQDHVTRTLRNALEKNRIHHAFLFSGARGVGKTTAARALARALNCEKGPTANPCGACPSCLEVGLGNSPDLIEIDGASNNSVDDIRELRDTVRYAPQRGKWKIYLIDEVHMLSKGAFNALLKTLEEPPPHVVFIFATTEANKIPETILSRVQRFDFKRIPIGQVAAQLRKITESEGVSLTETALRMIARAGDGSMRDSQSLLDQAISYGLSETKEERVISDKAVVDALGLLDRNVLFEMLEGLVSGAPDRCLAAIERVYEFGFELSEFTAEMLELLRNAAFVRLSPGARKFIDAAPDEMERLDAITRDVDSEVLSRLFSAMLEVHDQVSRASRPRVVLEMAVARLASTRPVQPVATLVNRLEDLERRLRQSGGSAGVGGLKTPRAPRPSSFMEPPPGSSVATTPHAHFQGPTASAQPTDNAPPPDPWVSFQDQVRAIGSGALAEAEPRIRDVRLMLLMNTSHGAAEARRQALGSEISGILSRCYPTLASIEIVPPAEAKVFRERERREAIENDPAFKRVLDRLGASVQKLTLLNEPEG